MSISIKSGPVNIITMATLRGVAAILVGVYHFNYAFIISDAHSNIFLRKCYIMVDLFFIMSGFIMMHVYQTIFSQEVQYGSFRKFILARFARIYPLHLFMLLLFVVMIYGGGHGGRANPIYEPSAIISNLLLLQSFGIHETGTWNVASWSISAEWWSYMVFPFICFLIKSRKISALIILSVFVLFLYLLIIYYLPRNELTEFYPDIDVSYRYGLLRGLAGFTAGSLSYLFYLNERIRNMFKNDILSITLLVLCCVLMELAVFDLYMIPFFVLLIVAFASNEGMVCRVSGNKFVQLIGDISYSFYMVHGLIILLIIQVLMKTHFGYTGPELKNVFYGIPYIFMFLLMVTGISYLTYTFIEKPARNFINHRINKRKVLSAKA